MEQFVGLIISVNKYKDNNGVINILTENGIVSILGRGIYKDDNKNHIFTNKFIYANFDVYKGKVGGYKLRTAKIIKFYPSAIESYEYLLALDYLSEVVYKTIDDVLADEDLDFKSNLLHTVIKTLDYMIETRRIYASLSYFSSTLIKELGIKPNLNKLENIESQTYSFLNGSIVANTKKENNDIVLSKENINCINMYLCCDNIDEILIGETNSKFVFIFFNRQIESSFSIKLNSLNLIL